MNTYKVHEIGAVRLNGDGYSIALQGQYAAALQGLQGFGHVQVLWWFSESDGEEQRATLQEPCPYKGGPETLGVFATRSPNRANPIGLTCAEITYIDVENATLGIAYTDALPGTPVLDIKPYTPSLDRVENPKTPAWCAHWPQSLEDSADFDWESVFDF